MGTWGGVLPAAECRRLRLDSSSRIGRWRPRFRAGKGTEERTKAKASLLHNQAVSERQRVSRASPDNPHNIAETMRAGHQPKQMRVVGTLRFHKPSQITGSK